MKKVIEHLQEAKRCILNGNPFTSVTIIDGVIAGLRQAELESPPRWETPEQWEQRTGKAWPDDWAVYLNAWFTTGNFVGKSIYANGGRQIFSLKEARKIAERLSKGAFKFRSGIVCAAEAGPPPDDWMPEEER
jgi:hypothetical protein